MTDSKPLWQWDAQEIASATRAGKLSAIEATEAAIARMEEVNPALNAVVENLAAEARAEAAALDKSGAPKGPLHGVPVTIKINVDQKSFQISTHEKNYSNPPQTYEKPPGGRAEACE